ncbi:MULTISPECIES: MarR family transcriptional regulator [unclassified Thalassolituus]|uniref:MarR family winged helix-turn-helix transcriptional regulator n=1 Tax=unclassified Thalassolituus TaxID=2624967 RepID=UPI0026AF72BA|tara:strand:- start:14 stop:571 length:558 start_codon:yes stop_codon:yes gene_type:complete
MSLYSLDGGNIAPRNKASLDDDMNRYEEVLVALRRIIRATDLHSRQLSKISGLTAPQLLILQLLRQQEELTVGEVAQKVSLSQATVTTIIDRLEKRGLVRRERGSSDKRKVFVYLTPAANDILVDAPKPLQDSFIQQFQDLHDWEQTMILSSLERVAYMMDAQHIDASPVLDVGALDRLARDHRE